MRGPSPGLKASPTRRAGATRAGQRGPGQRARLSASRERPNGAPCPRLIYSRFKPVSLLKKCTVLPLNENETASPVLTMPACSMSEAACATITLS